MPKAPPKRCKNVLCKTRFEPHEGKQGYCTRCHDQRKAKQPRLSHNDPQYDVKAQEFYQSKQWKILSKKHKQQNALCIHCLDYGLVTPAQVSDHIIEIRDDWDKRLDPDNLQSLCHTCHNTKTAKERRKRLKNQR